jgi:hypothetical protein
MYNTDFLIIMKSLLKNLTLVLFGYVWELCENGHLQIAPRKASNRSIEILLHSQLRFKGLIRDSDYKDRSDCSAIESILE